MERIYALGVSCIEFTQYWFQDYEGYFEVVNNLSNPHYVMEVLLPLVSIIDSVFGAQLLLCMSFGGWLNAVMKWWLLEDRPYWWVRETSFYGSRPPALRQSPQTCETGPGCPSGHASTTAMVLMLAVMWCSHVMNDRKCYIWWWKLVLYPLCGAALCSVMVARMYVATHFPHQVIAGALVGAFLAPALCIYVSDPYVWRYGVHTHMSWRRGVAWHVFSAAAAVAIAGVTYLSLIMCGWDPHWTVKLAFRWCQEPGYIHVSTTPLFALVQTTAHLLGWALAVTPVVAQYRHYSKDRSLILSAFTTGIILYVYAHLRDNISKENAVRYYAINFFLGTLKPLLLLRIAPLIAMWPYIATSKNKKRQ